MTAEQILLCISAFFGGACLMAMVACWLNNLAIRSIGGPVHELSYELSESVPSVYWPVFIEVTPDHGMPWRHVNVVSIVWFEDLVIHFADGDLPVVESMKAIQQKIDAAVSRVRPQQGETDPCES